MRVYDNSDSRVSSQLIAMSQPTILPVRIITHNIRYATESPFDGEELWSVRCPLISSELVFNSQCPSTTFICLQEVLHGQLIDIETALNQRHSREWAYIGVGRDDGLQAGEYSPIFYRPSVWKLMHWETKWLSETPGQPSKGWDASSIRIVTIGHFMHVQHHLPIVVMSTHLDNDGAQSRLESARLILNVARQDSWQSLPVFIGGDFNSPPSDEAYKLMTARDSPMLDTRLVLPRLHKYGNEMTFTSFGGKGSEPPSIIDFIFIKKSNCIMSKSYAILDNKFDDGIYNSDHRAVVVDIDINMSQLLRIQ